MEYFTRMNEAYINKRYPKRSVFEAVDKSVRKNGTGVYIFFGLVLLFFGAVAVFGIGQTVSYLQSGEKDMVSAGLVITGVCLAFCALSIWMILLTKKRNGMGAEGWIKKSAQKSGYDESVIRDFDSQAMASDSYILNLMGKMKAVISGQRDGVLTRDYIYLADSENIVMKRSDIISACLVDRVYYISVGNTRKAVHYLSISLISNKGSQTQAEISRESANALLELLLSQNPQIDTRNGKVMQEKDYGRYIKETLSALS